jgi:outer membrane protein assembly factor BamB
LKKILSIGIILLFIFSSIPIAVSNTQLNITAEHMWSMYGYDIHHTSKSPFNTNHVNGGEKWRYFTDDWIDETPVIDNNGIIYIVSDHNRIHAITPDGELLWDTGTGSFIAGSSPAIGDDGTIYVGAWDAIFYALNSDGTKKWTFQAAGSAIASSPTIAEDGTIYFGTMGLADEGGSRVYAVNSDGSEKWFFQTGHHVISSPAIGEDGTIFIGSGDKFFYAINPDGSLKWKYETDNVIKAPASIGKDGTVYIRSWDDYLYAFNPNDGTVIWKTELYSGYDGCPAIGNDGTIYMGGTERIYALNPDGSIKWETLVGEDKYAHKSSIALSSEDNIYVGICLTDTAGGEIISLNLNGQILWRKTIANKWVFSSPSIGSDGTVYIGSSSYRIDLTPYGILYAIKDNVQNNPPSPPVITGETYGKLDNVYEYKFKSIDSEGENLFYLIQFGHGYAESHGPYPSGEEIIVYHVWDSDDCQPGEYIIEALARDEFGMESEISTLEVTMPKTMMKINLINRFFENFPLLNIILNWITKPIINNNVDLGNDNHYNVDDYNNILSDEQVEDLDYFQSYSLNDI